MIYVYYAIIALAILAMLVGMVLALRLRRIARGGQVGKVVNLLVVFIGMFTAGYLFAPLMPKIPPAVGLVVMSLVYLFGALYVILVLWLIQSLVRKVMAELEL